jgi:hypothetical protein
MVADRNLSRDDVIAFGHANVNTVWDTTALSEYHEGFETTDDDDDLPIAITHSRDRVIFDGKVEQDYQFLTYRFKSRDGEIRARTYLDEPWTVSITEPMDCESLDADILAYLQKRFNLIRRLGGPDGYIDMWVRPKHGGQAQ